MLLFSFFVWHEDIYWMKRNDLVDKFLPAIKCDLWLFIPILTIKWCEGMNETFPFLMPFLGIRPGSEVRAVVIPVLYDLVWAANLKM